MQSLSTAHLDYEGTDGLYHTITPVSIVNRQMMLERIKQMHKLMEAEPDRELTFAGLYNINKQFRYICEQILLLSNIEPATVSLDLLYTLLLPSEQSELGLLVELNFSEAELVPGERLEKKRAELASMLGRIWAATEDFNQAYEAMTTLSASDLYSALEARAGAIESSMQSPESRQRKEMQAKAKELIKNRLSNDPNAPK